MMFIPKPGKVDCTEARVYCPISLWSLLLKMMGKLIYRHIREGALKKCLLHQRKLLKEPHLTQ